MKRKLSTVSLIAVMLMTAVFTSACQAKLDMTVLHSSIDAGATETFTVLHTSDTHLTLAEKTDSSEVRRKARKRTRRFKNLQEQKLQYVANLASGNGYLVVHTGDLMDFPTDANIARAKTFFEETGCLYVPGNHEPEDKNGEYYKKLSEASPRSLDFFCEEIKGVCFVGIDNSDHKMTREQLDALKEVVSRGKPIVLLLHVPLYNKDLYDASIVDDGSAYLMAVPEELMTNYPAEKYAQQKADAVTREAYDYILSQSATVKGILCGHLHIDFETNVGGIPQYVVGLDSVRLIEIR